MGRRPPASLWVRGLQCGAAVLAVAIGRLVGWLPGPLGRALGVVLGDVLYGTLPGRRRVALANLERVFAGSLSAAERAALARANFRHLAVTAVECCRLYFGPRHRLLAQIRVEGLEHLRSATAVGRGVLYLGAHFGNWELLAAAHALTGLPLAVVIRPLDNPYLEALLAGARRRAGLRLIAKREAVRGVRDALGRGDAVGILLDQDAGRHGVFVPFLGAPASTSRSLAVLALKGGAPVVPAFIHRLPSGDHQLTLEAAIPLVITGDRQRDILENTRRFNAVIERHVRAHPEQWFWVHRRWKTPPA